MDRRTAVAGSFYPASKDHLKSDLESLFAKAKEGEGRDVRALIAPHAGYLFSGVVAATTFKQIDPQRVYERVFLIGAAHREYFRGVALYGEGDFLMPYGREYVDRELISQLIEEGDGLFNNNVRAHAQEHSLEVILPFVNYQLKEGYKIVPILLGDLTDKELEKVAEILSPWFGLDSLFVFSSDFSHYPSYDDANRVDKLTMEAITTRSAQHFKEYLAEGEFKEIDKLSTPICGWSAVMVLLHLLEGRENDFSINALHYQNSGDNVSFGDKEGVVGYWGASLVEHGREAKFLKRVASLSIEVSLRDKGGNSVDRAVEMAIKEFGWSEVPANLKRNFPLFVTLRSGGNLRGCIGYLKSFSPLYKEVGEVAIAAALQDFRFDPLTLEELSNLDFEISLLSPFTKVNGPEDIIVGRDGIYLVKGKKSGLYLPEVATDLGWDSEQFLGHCAKDKAYIGWDGWRDEGAEIYTFTTFKL